MIRYESTDEFNKDFKKLLKCYNTLNEDFNNFKKYAIESYFEKKINVNAFVKIEGKCNDLYDSFKVKKFACKALKNSGNRSGIRIIFIYNKIEKIVKFIEIYYKGDKENEDGERILREIKKSAQCGISIT